MKHKMGMFGNLLQILSILCGALGIVCFFLPLFEVSLYATFPEGDTVTASAFRLVQGITVAGFTVQKPVLWVLLILPVMGVLCTVFGRWIPRGIGTCGGMIFFALQCTCLCYLRHLLTVYLIGYRFSLCFAPGWFLSFCAGGIALLFTFGLLLLQVIQSEKTE